MHEHLCLERANHIIDETERVFALAFLAAFSEIKVFHQPIIYAKSGRAQRLTVPDFKLENKHGEILFIEITNGNKLGKRKRRQRKTVNLAGFGRVYAVVYGSDIETITDLSTGDLHYRIRAILDGRFDATLFSFE